MSANLLKVYPNNNYFTYWYPTLLGAYLSSIELKFSSLLVCLNEVQNMEVLFNKVKVSVFIIAAIINRQYT